MLVEVAMMNGEPDQKSFTMYKMFEFVKHGVLGSKLRYNMDECVQELIISTFPVKAGKRKRSFKSLSNEPEDCA